MDSFQTQRLPISLALLETRSFLLYEPYTIHVVDDSNIFQGPIQATVAAGGTVTVVWNTWPVGHYGPVLNYMAKCNGECSSFKGDSGSPWFKVTSLRSRTLTFPDLPSSCRFNNPCMPTANGRQTPLQRVASPTTSGFLPTLPQETMCVSQTLRERPRPETFLPVAPPRKSCPACGIECRRSPVLSRYVVLLIVVYGGTLRLPSQFAYS